MVSYGDKLGPTKTNIRSIRVHPSHFRSRILYYNGLKWEYPFCVCPFDSLSLLVVFAEKKAINSLLFHIRSVYLFIKKVNFEMLRPYVRKKLWVFTSDRVEVRDKIVYRDKTKKNYVESDNIPPPLSFTHMDYRDSSKHSCDLCNSTS